MVTTISFFIRSLTNEYVFNNSRIYLPMNLIINMDKHVTFKHLTIKTKDKELIERSKT